MTGAPRRTVDLADDLSAAVDEAVRSGEFADASAVVDTAVREWRERRENLGYTISELQALWREGRDSGPARPVTEDLAETVKREGRRRLAERPKAAE